MCLIASTVMLLLALSGVPWKLFKLTPSCVRDGMPVGLGMLLALNGFQNIGLVASDEATGLTMRALWEFAPIAGLTTTSIWLRISRASGHKVQHVPS